MYQFYYSDAKQKTERTSYKKNVRNYLKIDAVRPTMWEEHCLECSAPLCFKNCVHFAERRDGRCKRFADGLSVFPEKRGCCGQGVHVKFRKWGNMMTILFPTMLVEPDYQKLAVRNQRLGYMLRAIVNSKLPKNIRWQVIRSVEFIRRRKLRKLSGLGNEPDAFVFHGFSYSDEEYRLIIELYQDHTSVFKTSLVINPGENMHILARQTLSAECSKSGNLLKVYPENDLEAELDILWCDFVQGTTIGSENSEEYVKCIVWDLDGTLWDGTLIETEDVELLQIKQSVLAVIKELDCRGIIQSIASKNNFDSAWNRLEQLGIAEYFLYPQIHWGPKSDSIKQIAKNLNIGTGSFAFIDDTVFEREQVHSVLPEVRTYDVSDITDLLNKAEFSVPVTEESKNRRKMYRAEMHRNELKLVQNTDIEEFLRKCNLCITIFEPESESEIERCYELVVRTNQLNMSGKKYTREEFNKIMLKENCKNFAFSCKDDFGEYGIVGYGQYQVITAKLVFTEFVMSCRVAGKYVESGLFTALLKSENCKSADFSVLKTKKNALLRNTLEEIGFVTKNETNNDISYSFDENLRNKEIVSVLKI